MSKDFTLIIFVVLATLSSGLLGSAALAAVRGSARIPLKAIVSSGAVSLAVGAGLSLATLGHPELFLGLCHMSEQASFGSYSVPSFALPAPWFSWS